LKKTIFRVLVVDDYDGWREFVSTTLRKKPELRIVGAATDGLEAVQLAERQGPDLILLDVGLPTLNGIEAARRILKCAPKTIILFVSEQRSSDIAEEALCTGARGYLVKADAATELIPAVEAVLLGKRFVSASLHVRDLVDANATTLEGSQRVERNPYLHFRHSASISEFLASIIEATAADFGNVQLFDSANRVLRIVVQRGFESEFLDYFDTVSCDEGCACGMAMNERSRMVVPDVATDPLFSKDSREVLLKASVRSVQSTPLIDSFGNLLGMVSTHHSRPGGPMPHMWKPIDDLVAQFLADIGASA